MAHDPDNQVITQALVAIGQQFDMFTVAECVETPAEMAWLQTLGIDCLQGYHFGAPTLTPPWKTRPNS
jgi:EAL domain-containing protein (putative c-di-GMP-specific phosphodiesterase class I)